jgi:hypothetical protein
VDDDGVKVGHGREVRPVARGDAPGTVVRSFENIVAVKFGENMVIFARNTYY